MSDASGKSAIEEQIPDVAPKPQLGASADKAIEEIEGQSLDQQKFTLEKERAGAKLEHGKREFTPLLWAKIGTIAISLLYVVTLATSLVFFVWWGDKAKHDWHVLIALVSGGYLSIFAVLAVLIKGLFHKEKDETPPITLSETLKAVMEAVKAAKTR